MSATQCNIGFKIEDSNTNTSSRKRLSAPVAAPKEMRVANLPRGIPTDSILYNRFFSFSDLRIQFSEEHAVTGRFRVCKNTLLSCSSILLNFLRRHQPYRAPAASERLVRDDNSMSFGGSIVGLLKRSGLKTALSNLLDT